MARRYGAARADGREVDVAQAIAVIEEARYAAVAELEPIVGRARRPCRSRSASGSGRCSTASGSGITLS